MIPVVIGSEQELQETIEKYKNTRLNVYNYIQYTGTEANKQLIATSITGKLQPNDLTVCLHHFAIEVQYH